MAITQQERENYKKVYKNASNKVLLSDYKGMRDGKYVTWGQAEARKEIERRKKAGLMRKTAMVKKRSNQGMINFGYRPI